MNIRHTTLTAAVLAASVVSSAATAAAAPAGAVPAVGYHANLVDGAVVTTLDNGVFTLTGDQRSVDIRDAAGQVLDALPLSFTLDGQHLPLRQQITDDGRTLRLVPDVTGLDRSALKPVASPVENQLAMNDLINAVSLGTSIGSLVGTAVGAVAGIGVGIALAGASCLVLSLGCVVTVLPIVSMVAAAGGLVGLVAGGGPSAAAAAFDYFSTLRAAPGQSKYGQYAQGKTGDPAPAAN
ncbi:ammonium transporter [Nocardia sp. NPDC101769]|uniref:ammonium transporter n=1 Tax=Nocardia sp. NPDC101769 TaxID=3364333 RepID=UPI00382917D8